MAQAVNNFTVTGNLTKDPELKKTANGKPYTFIVVAVNKTKKDEVNFISLLAWDKLAENAVKYLHKGEWLYPVYRNASNHCADSLRWHCHDSLPRPHLLNDRAM